MRQTWIHKEAGFTLTELLVVLSILAVIITIIFTSYRPRTDKLELRKHAMIIAALMRSQRSLAIRQNKATTFVINVETGQYGEGKVKRRHSLPSNVAIRLLTAKSEVINTKLGNIRFFPDGSSTRGTLILKYKSFEERIEIDWLTGIVRLKQGHGHGS